MQAAAVAIQNAYGIARHRDGATRVNVGRIEGGSASNVIAEEVTIDAEVRGETTALMTYARTELERILYAAAELHDCDVAPHVISESPCVDSHPALREVVGNVAWDVDGVERVIPSEEFGVSEDGTYLMQQYRTPAASSYVLVGTDHPTSHHTPTFDIDEESLDRRQYSVRHVRRTRGVDRSGTQPDGRNRPQPGEIRTVRPVTVRRISTVNPIAPGMWSMSQNDVPESLEAAAESDRPRGILTPSDRDFLLGRKTDYTDHSRKQKRNRIRRRVRNAILDFSILFECLEERDRKTVFDPNDEDREAYTQGITDMLAFLHLGTMGYHTPFKDMLSEGVGKAEQQLSPGRTTVWSTWSSTSNRSARSTSTRWSQSSKTTNLRSSPTRSSARSSVC